jgi:multidrug transporter EmrE-like cation transporter
MELKLNLVGHWNFHLFNLMVLKMQIGSAYLVTEGPGFKISHTTNLQYFSAIYSVSKLFSLIP